MSSLQASSQFHDTPVIVRQQYHTTLQKNYYYQTKAIPRTYKPSSDQKQTLSREKANNLLEKFEKM